MLEPPIVSVHLLPSLIPPGTLRGGVAIVVDVLRATTAMVHALSSGCEAIIPCLEVDEARRVAASLPGGTALLGGERGGLPIEGFDYGNSPASYTPEVCRGKTLVMTTTNGTRAILASLEADRVLIAAFSNIKATVATLSSTPSEAARPPIHLVCSGTDGLVSYEDTLLAGLAVSMLGELGAGPANDQALIARSAWLDVEFGHDKSRPLAAILARGVGGQRVTSLGLAADIVEASRADRFDFAAELRRDPLRIVRS